MEKKNNSMAVDVLLVYIFPIIAIILLLIKNYVLKIMSMSFLEMFFSSISILASTNASVISSMHIIKKMENIESIVSKRFLFFFISIAIYFVLELIESEIRFNLCYIIDLIILLMFSVFITHMVIKDFCETNRYINQNFSIINSKTEEKYNNAKDKNELKMKGEPYNVKG